MSVIAYENAALYRRQRRIRRFKALAIVVLSIVLIVPGYQASRCAMFRWRVNRCKRTIRDLAALKD